MNGYIAIDEKGWVTEIHTDETSVNHEIHMSDGHIHVPSPDVVKKIIQSQMIMFWDGKQFCQVKDSKDIWKRLRINNIHGVFASREHQNLLNSLDDSFPDVPTGTVIDNPQIIGKAFEPTFEGEIKPGLKVSLSGEEDIDTWESQMVKSGLYTEDEAWKSVSLWFSDPMVWPVKTTWKDSIIQLELYILNRENNNVTASYNDHIDRVRPLWFWKQVSLPTLKCLYGYGFENINSQVRIDKPDYVKFLAEAYGHEVLRKTAGSFVLRLNIKEAIKNIGDWPKRRTMGTDWKWEKDGILVREATDSDFPAIYAAMDANWGDKTRKDLALTRLNDTWELDAGSVLIATKDGKIILVRGYRERKDTTMNIHNSALHATGSKDEELAIEGFKVWQIAVGYKTTSFIIETKLFAGIQDRSTQRGWKVFSQDNNITECRLTL